MGIFDVSFKGIGANGVTFKSALTRGSDEGKVVKVSANDTVALCDDGDLFAGVVKTIAESDGAAVVQTKGFVTVSYSGTAPTLGWCVLDADGAGGVTKTGSRSYEVVNVDSSNNLVTFDLG